jgi:putative PEP-CTERM system histidine kinase
MEIAAAWVVIVHALAATMFAALAGLLAVSNRLHGRAAVLALGSLGMTAWNAAIVWTSFDAAAPRAIPELEALQVICWLTLISPLATLIGSQPLRPVLSALAVAAVGVAAVDVLRAHAAPLYVDAAVAASFAILWILIETWRAPGVPHVTWARFGVCAAAVLVANIVIASRAAADPGVAAVWLSLRAPFMAALPPLLAVVCRRAEVLGVRVFVSRYATTAFIAAILSAAAVGLPTALVLKFAPFADERARVLAAVAVAAAAALAFWKFGAPHIDSLRVQLSKHFYRFKYDYREEWLKLTANLSSGNELPVPKRAIKALADLISSPGGTLFVLERDSQTFAPVASWNTSVPLPLQEYRRDDLIDLMEESAWIVDGSEPRALAAAEAHSFLSDILLSHPGGVLMVPLLLPEHLFGFVVLERPPALGVLTYEEIDLLRTAGRQVAGYLGQHFMAARLGEAKQFEAFGKMAAFLVHDLTNISAQQSLIVQNAERHTGNAEFFADAMRTIASSVSRINRLVMLVRSGVEHSDTRAASATSVVEDALKLCAEYLPRPSVNLSDEQLVIVTDPDRLSHGLAHLIRNSQQAATATGVVSVSLARDAGHAVISVSDNGCGMSDDFVHQRLFRPFESTKGGTALGIGAFQLRDVVRASRGTLGVRTIEGAGSVFSIRIPLAPEPASTGAAAVN